MNFSVVTLFPEMFQAIEDFGVIGRAIKKNVVTLETWNPREYTHDKHRTVDDRPYGGGPGMLMKVQPLQDAINAARADAFEKVQTGQASAPDLTTTNAVGDEGQANVVKTVYLSPQGRKLDHQLVTELSKCKSLVLVCGRYEGVDERLIKSEIDEEVSIGDFVLSGGELASMVVIDAVSRLIPGVLGKAESAEEDSFVEGLLDCPHYTRPESLNGQQVPDVLMSGNHGEIKRWRLKQALGRTWLRRPDLLDKKELNCEEQLLLQEFIKEESR